MVLRESKFARNISTCVEKTNYPNDNDLLPWKHLHMRGENFLWFCVNLSLLETSPHAWRKLPDASSDTSSVRNISTCVEKTS